MFEKTQKNIKMKVKDYLKFFFSGFCFRKFEKKLQLQHCNQHLHERLDIVYIIHRLTEVEKIKMLLLNNEQRKLFEFLPKPLIKLNPKEPVLDETNLHDLWKGVLFFKQKSYVQKCMEASQAFAQIKKK